jgi:DNA-binding transcriptional regulator YdaS (Cro superfamily)
MYKKPNRDKPLLEAIKIAGSTAKLAALITEYNISKCKKKKCKKNCKACRVSRQAVDQWERVPAPRVISVEMVLNKAIDRYKLRPDIFQKD